MLLLPLTLLLNIHEETKATFMRIDAAPAAAAIATGTSARTCTNTPCAMPVAASVVAVNWTVDLCTDVGAAAALASASAGPRQHTILRRLLLPPLQSLMQACVGSSGSTDTSALTHPQFCHPSDQRNNFRQQLALDELFRV